MHLHSSWYRTVTTRNGTRMYCSCKNMLEMCSRWWRTFLNRAVTAPNGNRFFRKNYSSAYSRKTKNYFSVEIFHFYKLSLLFFRLNSALIFSNCATSVQCGTFYLIDSVSSKWGGQVPHFIRYSPQRDQKLDCLASSDPINLSDIMQLLGIRHVVWKHSVLLCWCRNCVQRLRTIYLAYPAVRSERVVRSTWIIEWG